MWYKLAAHNSETRYGYTTVPAVADAACDWLNRHREINIYGLTALPDSPDETGGDSPEARRLSDRDDHLFDDGSTVADFSTGGDTTQLRIEWEKAEIEESKAWRASVHALHLVQELDEEAYPTTQEARALLKARLAEAELRSESATAAAEAARNVTLAIRARIIAIERAEPNE